MFRYRTEPIRPPVIVSILLAGFLIALGHAQDPPKPNPVAASGSSTLAPSKNVPTAAERIVLKVGNLQVTQADFESMISVLEAQQGPADLSRKAIGENYASLLALSQQAVANHLESSPDVVRQLALDRTQILSNAEFAKLKAQAKPTSEEISAYYSTHLADYDTVQIRRLFIWKRVEGSNDGRGVSPQDAKALADAIRQAFATGSDPRKTDPRRQCRRARYRAAHFSAWRRVATQDGRGSVRTQGGRMVRV